MPSVHFHLARNSADSAVAELGKVLSPAERVLRSSLHALIARVTIPFNDTSPSGLIEANTRDPFNKSGKYALGWVYFAVILLVFAALLRIYHAATDRIRTALHEDEVLKSTASSPDTDYELSAFQTDRSTVKMFPRHPMEPQTPQQSEISFWAFRPFHISVALFRYVFYRPLPTMWLGKRERFEFPPLSVVVIAFVALAFTMLYCFLPQPLYWKSLEFGSPPLAIRAGMLAVALVPWIIALAMKANMISVITGIGHERLNVLHRWAGYLCLVLSLVHTLPFYIQRHQDHVGYRAYRQYFDLHGIYIFGTGLACLAPLAFLSLQSLPFVRRKAYEVFIILHIPVAMLFFAMLFWHCRNFLTSWNYLFATLAIWLISYVTRLFFLNWANPWRMSWLIGDDASVTLLPENAVKITIPTQVRWKPGQFVYLRMPGVSIFENHPFTISSLCSEELPSEYGDEYRDMILVFRPFGGFTRRLLDQAQRRGPYHTYRAFIDGPYGGMRRRLESFDQVILIAGGSGITALVSQLLDLIKRMRDGKAITKSVKVIWAMKRPETLEWFREELRICRECAPPESVHCQFFITAAKRHSEGRMMRMTAQSAQQHISTYFRDHINDAFQGIAEKRASYVSKRNSAMIKEEAAGDPDREKELRYENEDTIAPLPKAHVTPARPQTQDSSPPRVRNFSHPLQQTSRDESPYLEHPEPAAHLSSHSQYAPSPVEEDDRDFDSIELDNPHHVSQGRNLGEDLHTAVHSNAPASSILDPNLRDEISSSPTFLPPQQQQYSADPHQTDQEAPYSFGFPSTPTEFQKNLMRFAFLPAAARRGAADGWTTEYGRPDLAFLLREMGESEELGRRTCISVCGPPAMRIVVSSAVAELQKKVLKGVEGVGGRVEEVFLHAENYAL